MKERTILHCDCNGFYASVECVLNPKLNNVPMAVCGSADNRHGIVLAKNELAKKQGVVTAETIWQARKKCPELVTVPPHHDLYNKYSKAINAIYERYTDMVEPFGIDESWLDVSGSLNLFGTGPQIADQLRKVVKEEIKLTISVGVSFNKIFAKLGSDYKKPDATTVITRENFKDILYPLPARDMLYVGRSMASALEKLGVRTIGELAKYDRAILEQKFGKSGIMVYDFANGIEDSPVSSAYERRQIKSVGNGMTYRRNLKGYDDIMLAVSALADTVAVRMRAYGVKCKTIQVMIRDTDFKTISRQKPAYRPTQLAKDITDGAMELIQASWDLNKPIRMLTVTGANLTEEDAVEEQMDIFRVDDAKAHEKQGKIESTMDSIRSKYGMTAITTGRIVKNDLGLFGIEDIEHGSEEN